MAALAGPNYLCAEDLLPDTVIKGAAELRRIDRYERRVISRRKNAIWEVDRYLRTQSTRDRRLEPDAKSNEAQNGGHPV